MKNINKIRTKEQHKVGRIIRFGSKPDEYFFLLMYRKYIGTLSRSEIYPDSIHITISKEDFDKIVKEYKLMNERPKNSRSKVRFWRTEAAGE